MRKRREMTLMITILIQRNQSTTSALLRPLRIKRFYYVPALIKVIDKLDLNVEIKRRNN